MNESKRQQKVARLVQREIGDILQRDKSNILNNAFVTVADVQITADLSIAKIYLSMVLLKPDERQKLVEKINNRKGEIRGILGRRIGKQMRIIPDLIFYHDDLEEQAMKLDALIDSLDIPPEEGDESSDKEQ